MEDLFHEALRANVLHFQWRLDKRREGARRDLFLVPTTFDAVVHKGSKTCCNDDTEMDQ